MTAPVTDPNAAAEPEQTDEFNAVRHVYEPHSIGLPPLRPYVRELWRRREFAFELARTSLRAQHFDTAVGQLWLVLNPLLLACVYFLLVDIIGARTGGISFFAHLMATLFVFHFVTDAIRQAVRSVTGGGRLILNTAFPRILLPAPSVIVAFKRFLPTIVVFIPAAIVASLPFGPAPAVAAPGLRAVRDPHRRALDARRRRPGLLPRPQELPPVRAADVAVRLADPLLRATACRTATTSCWS